MAGCLFGVMACSGATNKEADNKTGFTEEAAAPEIAAWFFRAVSGYPAAVSFEPVVLFTNGDYFDIGDEPVELLDVQSSKSKRPDAWGTWKKQGASYLLTNRKGSTHDYQPGSGNWFPAYAYTGAVKLKPAYEKTSGGDYGNGMSSLTIDKINFVDATHFTQGVNSGTSTPNVKAGKTSSSGGTYRIHEHTIEFTLPDGKVVQKSFAMGAEGSPAHAVNTLIFIGGQAYTDTE